MKLSEEVLLLLLDRSTWQSWVNWPKSRQPGQFLVLGDTSAMLTSPPLLDSAGCRSVKKPPGAWAASAHTAWLDTNELVQIYKCKIDALQLIYTESSPRNSSLRRAVLGKASGE